MESRSPAPKGKVGKVATAECQGCHRYFEKTEMVPRFVTSSYYYRTGDWGIPTSRRKSKVWFCKECNGRIKLRSAEFWICFAIAIIGVILLTLIQK
jgi:hypothetical protein